MSRASFKVLGEPGLIKAEVNTHMNTVVMEDNELIPHEIQFDNPITGTVYGTMLNFKGELERLGDDVNNEPYFSPPIAPVLYIKPMNTFNCYGGSIPMPVGISKLEMGASLGIVIGKQAVYVDESTALSYVAGYTIVNDVRIPHDNLFRPAIHFQARDGFCPIGPWIIDRHVVDNPDNISIRIYINDKLQQENSTSNLVRSVSRLLADVTEFMTLNPGDLLLVGVPEDAPQAKVGDKIRIEIDGIGSLENVIVDESESKWRKPI